jgi:5-methylcytosine-specific restriction endonuclease McrA
LTGWEKQEAIDKREEKVFARDNYTCQTCKESIYIHGTPQAAHRISKSKMNLKKYGPEIIHHPLNMVSVCSIGYCNDHWNIGNSPIEIEKLVDEILADIDKGAQ